jgi:hypothetical protein
MEAIAQGSFDAEVHRLEVGLRQLKTQYDIFFAGGVKLPPNELRAQIEAQIKRLSDNPAGVRFAQRFHLNALVGRFQSMCERWGKRMRAFEEAGGGRGGSAERGAGRPRERLLTRCLLTDPLKEKDTLLRVHGRYTEATRRLGGTPVAFDRFVQGIVAQTGRLREEADCGQIELRLVVRDDGVRLMARPNR